MVSRWTSLSLSICPSVCQSYGQSVRILFPDDNLSKHQWIFIKLGTCIDIVEIWFGLLMGKFCQCLLSAHDTIMVGYYSLTFLLHKGQIQFVVLLYGKFLDSGFLTKIEVFDINVKIFMYRRSRSFFYLCLTLRYIETTSASKPDSFCFRGTGLI